MQSKSSILIIENDVPMRKYLKLYLSSKGYGLFESESAQDGLKFVENKRPDLIIFDLALPGITGIDFVQALRRSTGNPIIVLSSKDEHSEKVALLLAGADDFLSKPFSPEELNARAQVALRRSLNFSGNGEDFKIVFENICIDLHGHRLFVDGQNIHLTPTEFRLLKCLALSPEKAISFATLLNEIRDRKIQGDPLAYLRVYIMQLRHKIEPDPAKPRYIVTVRGHGYLLHQGRQVDDKIAN